MKKNVSKLLSGLLCLVMLIGLLPTTAMAAGGIAPTSKYGENGKLQFTLGDSGVLTWSEVPGATAYDITVRVDGSLFKAEDGLTSTSYDLVGQLNEYKKDTGSVEVLILPNGENGYDYRDNISFQYSSPYPKLEAPTGLRWDGNAAVWNEVPNADKYTVYLYQPSGSGYNHWTTSNTGFDFTGLVVTGADWYFTVQAASEGNYRSSTVSESPRKTGSNPAVLYSIGAYTYDSSLGVGDSGGRVYLETDVGTDGWSAGGYIKEATDGSTVTVKAEPAEGYRFVEWRQGTQGSMLSTDATYTFTASGHKYLYAIFRDEDSVGYFPDGAGLSWENPAVCRDFAEFKYAMESEDIAYVALGTMSEAIPDVEGEGLVPAISVNGYKGLTLLGHATFVAPAGRTGYKTVCALLHTEEGDALNIYGEGSLTFRATASASYNAVVYNQGGDVGVHGATLRGSYNVATYGKAIWQDSGTLRVSDGQLLGEDALSRANTPRSHAAVSLKGGYALIYGGTFKSESGILSDPDDLYHGLEIAADARARIEDGIFYGIELPDQVSLSDYVDEGSTVSVEGGFVDSADCQTTQDFVEVFRLLTEVDLQINSPVAGKLIPFETGDVSMEPTGTLVKSVNWYMLDRDTESFEEIPSDSGARFQAGERYGVQIALTAHEGVKFAKSLNSATVNYETAWVLPFYENNGGTGIVLGIDLGECPATVGSVELTVGAPRQDGTPSQSVTCGSTAYKHATGSDSMWDVDVYWEESVYAPDEDSDWVQMEATDEFTVGYYYRASVNLMPTEGHRFAIDHNIEPDVTATVNGYYAEVGRYPEENPDEMIWVRCEFGKLNDTVIDETEITDVAEPTVGEYPYYTCSLDGTGYRLDTNYDYTDDDDNVCIKNGMGWWDVAGGTWMHEGDAFEFGQEYMLRIYLKTEDGYTFSESTGGGTAVINGVNAEYITAEETARTLGRTFTCGPREMKQVEVFGLTPPKAGQTPDYTVTMGQPEYYQLDPEDGIVWYDEDMEEMAPTDTFKRDVKYRLTITVVPVQVDGANVCKFIKRLADSKMMTGAILNGTPVKKDPDGWDDVTGGPKRLVIWYSFTEGAAEALPEQPVVLIQPEDVQASEGKTAEFFVAAMGSELTFQWQYRTSPSGTWKNSPAEGNKSTTLRVPATLSRHGYQYRCKVTDDNGDSVFSDPANLAVGEALAVTGQPQDVKLNVGGTAKFTVKATGSGVTYRWQYRKSASDTWKLTYADGYKTATLTIPGTADRNGYQYRCKVTDDGGESLFSGHATLTVVSLGITEQPKSASVSVGDTVKFKVEAVGDGLTYQWQYRASSTGAWKNSGTTGNKTATLTVTTNIKHNGYQYRCKVTDSSGNSLFSDAADLTVKSLSITGQPKSASVNLNGSVKFTVTAAGEGLTYRWQYRKSASDTWKLTYADGYKTNTLTIPGTADRNGYQYRCKVTDGGGESLFSDAATLTVVTLGISGQPKSAGVNVGDTVKFTVTAFGEGLKYQWQYRTSSTGTWKSSGATGNKTATLTVTTNINHDGYQYRCKVTDGNGKSVFSNAATLTVKSLSITTQPKSTTVKLDSTAKFTVAASGDGLKYQWQYRTTSTGTWKSATATGNKTATLSVPGTANRSGYQYRCKVTDANGTVVYSNAATLTVFGIVTHPGDQTAAGGTAKFTVKAIGDGLKYQWQYRTTPTGTWKSATATGNKTDTLSVPATASRNGYQYRCAVTDANGSTVYSNAATLTVK